MGLPKAKYTIWECMNVALALAAKAISETRALAKRMPAAGKDGLGFDDMSVDYDGDRTITLRFARGDSVKEFPFKLPIVIYRGVYTQSEAYEIGDSVTFGGSAWIKRSAGDAKPGDGNAWQLAVKKGRDGKDKS